MIEKGAIKDGKTLCSVLLYARRIAKKAKEIRNRKYLYSTIQYFPCRPAREIRPACLILCILSAVSINLCANERHSR